MQLTSMHLLWCRFALGAAGKLASIALEELSKPGKVEGGRDRRAASDAMPTSQPSRYFLCMLVTKATCVKVLHVHVCYKATCVQGAA